MNQSELKSRYDAAVELARTAGQRTLRVFQSAQLGTQTKGDGSPVTIADRDAEQFLRQQILERFPHDGVLGEEFGETPGTSGYRWILDPIDGTKAFVCGVPLYGTLVAVEFEGDARIGVIELPALDERVHACQGAGTLWQRGAAAPVLAQCSSITTLAQAVFCYTDEALFEARGAGRQLQALKHATRLTRGWNDCYAYALLATGRCDLVVDPKMEIWDSAALIPVIREAGGFISGWNNPAAIAARDCIAANGSLGHQALAVLKTQS